ncbi:MAG: cobalamin-dependent protein [Gemmatimonadota bacterium]
MTATHPVHPLGSEAKVLLSSVFGPYAKDDEYGSRTINPMELYQNQVTRVQGPFSLRMFHRSWGIMFIKENIEAPCTLLDFPSRDRFVEEISGHHYDVVGISSIMCNIGKVRVMCELVRQHLPEARIVVGGHIANVPDLQDQIDADHIVRGEGVAWMRRYLSEDVSKPVRHPKIVSGIGARAAGVALRGKPGNVAATLIPSVGCPLGCNFCSTSAMFGGKGNFIDFFQSGDELFRVMCELEEEMRVNSFFVMDENFLAHRKRALRLLDLMVEHGKSWVLYVFSSANVLRTYTIEQLVGLGISWVWMGLEGKEAGYRKLKGVDTNDLVRTLQEHGTCVLGSTIIGLEQHSPENIDAAIDYAVAHDTEFHQFMLYTPIPGTPLYAEHEAKGTLLTREERLEADTHGQFRFNFRHPHIRGGQESEFLLRAFRRDYDINGPSICRVARTTLRGWRRYKNHADGRIRRRFAFQSRNLAFGHAATIWAARRRFRGNPKLVAKLTRTLKEFYREFGLRSRLGAPLIGRILGFTLRREERKLRSGWTYEPPTFREVNEAMREAEAA